MAEKPWASSSRPGRRGFPRRVARRVLARDPICALALPGCTEVSTEADHIIPYPVAMAYGWTKAEYDDEANGQGVCETCHRIKSTREAQQARWSPLRRRQAAAAAAARRRRPPRAHPGIIDRPPPSPADQATPPGSDKGGG